MTVEDIKQYCMSKHAAYETQPFGDAPICYKLNNKIFAQLYSCWIFSASILSTMAMAA